VQSGHAGRLFRPGTLKEDTMSRVTTPPPAPGLVGQPGQQIPQEKIAQRAYEKWLKRGCTHGRDVQDWTEAEAELRAEMRSGGSGTRR
jgi:hypothetical protein